MEFAKDDDILNIPYLKFSDDGLTCVLSEDVICSKITNDQNFINFLKGYVYEYYYKKQKQKQEQKQSYKKYKNKKWHYHIQQQRHDWIVAQENRAPMKLEEFAFYNESHGDYVVVRTKNYLIYISPNCKPILLDKSAECISNVFVKGGIIMDDERLQTLFVLIQTFDKLGVCKLWDNMDTSIQKGCVHKLLRGPRTGRQCKRKITASSFKYCAAHCTKHIHSEEDTMDYELTENYRCSGYDKFKSMATLIVVPFWDANYVDLVMSKTSREVYAFNNHDPILKKLIFSNYVLVSLNYLFRDHKKNNGIDPVFFYQKYMNWYNRNIKITQIHWNRILFIDVGNITNVTYGLSANSKWYISENSKLTSYNFMDLSGQHKISKPTWRTIQKDFFRSTNWNDVRAQEGYDGYMKKYIISCEPNNMENIPFLIYRNDVLDNPYINAIRWYDSKYFTVKYHDGEKKHICPICYEDDEDMNFIKFDCNHTICSLCYGQMISHSNDTDCEYWCIVPCPMCRKNIIPYKNTFVSSRNSSPEKSTYDKALSFLIEKQKEYQPNKMIIYDPHNVCKKNSNDFPGSEIMNSLLHYDHSPEKNTYLIYAPVPIVSESFDLLSKMNKHNVIVVTSVDVHDDEYNWDEIHHRSL